MAIRKHAAAKAVALATSAAAMFGVWVAVRSDPPPDATAATTASSATPAAQPARSTTKAEPTPAPRVHTRTRAS